MSHDGLTFDVDDSGPEGAEVAVLLHGWPQDRTSWRGVTDRLTAAGLRVVAPDLRGTSPGARPPHFRDYEMRHLVGDAMAIIDATGAERVHLVGHDWGGALAWAVSIRHPERLASLTVLSTAHPAAMRWALDEAGQWRHSWYMWVFAIPKLPAFVLRRFPRPLLRRLGLPAADVEHHAERLARPGVAQGGFDWYRATLTPRLRRRRKAGSPSARAGSAPLQAASAGEPVADVPTVYVWGSRDPAFGRPVAERTGELLRDRLGERGRFVEMDAAHWLPERRTDEVADIVLAQVEAARETGAA